MLLYQIHVRSWTDSHIFLPLRALSLLLANLVQILKEKKILHGLQRDILLPAINKTNGRNDLKVKVTSVRVDPRHQAPSYPVTRDPLGPIKTVLAKAVFNGERFLLNARNVLTDLFLDDAETLANGKLTFLQWLKNEKEIAGANIGNIIRNKNLAETIGRMMSPRKLKHFRSAVKRLFSNPDLNSLRLRLRRGISDWSVAAPSHLTRRPVAVTKVHPLNTSSPLSVKEQTMLQYMLVILGGAVVLAV